VVKIQVTVEVEEGISLQELKEWVVAEDGILSGATDAISIENVGAGDILTHLLTSGIQWEITDQEVTE
jgi:hypothetical protein